MSDTTMKNDALIYCCRSEKYIGNLHRTISLAGKLAESFRVTILLDEDTPLLVDIPDSVKLVYLPVLCVDRDSSPIAMDQSERLKERIVVRRDVILSEFEQLKPQVVIVDAFPFHQHRLRGEVLPMIERARNGLYGESIVVCTTDSIMVDESAEGEEHADAAAAMLDKYFDLVVVQSDPVFARLEEFFKPRNTLHTPIYHAGFVMAEPRNRPVGSSRKNRILVSAGDGLYGGALFRAAIEAQRVLHPVSHRPMKIVAGPRLPENEYRELVDRANGVSGLSITRTVDNLREEMGRAGFSVSQCDYGSALNAITTQTPSLFVPCADRGRREQIVRAQRLVYWGAGRLLLPHHLNAASLTNEVNQLLHLDPRKIRFDTDGAANTVSLIERAAHLGKMGTVSSHSSADGGRPRSSAGDRSEPRD
jgi:predicted glycosyltransferase